MGFLSCIAFSMGKTIMLMIFLIFCLNLVSGKTSPNSYQERKNRLNPDYQPFQHPSKKTTENELSFGPKHSGNHHSKFPSIPILVGLVSIVLIWKFKDGIKD